MGFGTVAASIVMFIAVLSISTAVFMAMKQDMQSQSDAMHEQSKFLSNNLKTDISIQNVVYDNETNITTLTVRNTGKTKLSVDLTDIYLGSVFIPRDIQNRTIAIDPSTDTSNVGIWDTNEVVIITVQKDLKTGDYTAKVSVQYDAYDEDVFSVSYT